MVRATRMNFVHYEYTHKLLLELLFHCLLVAILLFAVSLFASCYFAVCPVRQELFHECVKSSRNSC